MATTTATTMAVAAGNPNTSPPATVEGIVLPRRFDVHQVACFEAAVNRVSESGALVVIDASAVRYLDRSAMDALIQARLRCIDHGGDLTLSDLSVAARVILELTGRYEALNPRRDAA